MKGKLKTVGVLIPMRGSAPSGPPESLPIGRAALHLAKEGIQVLFGDTAQNGRMSGAIAEPGRWRDVAGVAVDAVYDRYPSQKEELTYRQVVTELQGVPLGNPMSMTLLCRDKLKSQRLLEQKIRFPRLFDKANMFGDELDLIKAGFLKPRFGAFGRGVRRVVSGDDLPSHGEGAVRGVIEPMLLQEAVLPPSGVAGISIRVLSSRLPGGGWMISPGVARVSDADPVVNVSRGASAHPADDMLSTQAKQDVYQMIEVATSLLAAEPEGNLLLEIGFDFVLDQDGKPWMIELNSRPRGRVELLGSCWPERFARAHLDAVAAPIRYLASL